MDYPTFADAALNSRSSAKSPTPTTTHMLVSIADRAERLLATLASINNQLQCDIDKISGTPPPPSAPADGIGKPRPAHYAERVHDIFADFEGELAGITNRLEQLSAMGMI